MPGTTSMAGSAPGGGGAGLLPDTAQGEAGSTSTHEPSAASAVRVTTRSSARSPLLSGHLSISSLGCVPSPSIQNPRGRSSSHSPGPQQLSPCAGLRVRTKAHRCSCLQLCTLSSFPAATMSSGPGLQVPPERHKGRGTGPAGRSPACPRKATLGVRTQPGAAEGSESSRGSSVSRGPWHWGSWQQG